MRRSSRWAAVAVLAACATLASQGARGETVVTNDGKSYSGTVTVTPHDAVCVSPGIRRTFSLAVIAEIELTDAEKADLDAQERKLQALDAAGIYKLGMWLKSKHQLETAQDYFTKAIAVQPDLAGARKELGYVRKGAAWEYSPALHEEAMYDWVGKKSVDFHLKLACQLHELKLGALEEKELRRVLQADEMNKTAINMIRPILATYKLKNRYRLPFAGTWLAVSGPNISGHGDYANMMNAWDFRRVNEKGEVSSGPEDDLKSYFTFLQPVYAPADGEVYEVRDGFPDNPVGGVAPIAEANRVHLKHANGERSVIGHLQKGTIRVKVGDKVKEGQVLGLLGNSGRSATPHLHFAIFDDDGISLPMKFADFDVLDAGQWTHVDSGTMEQGKVYQNRFADAKAK